MDLVHRAKIFGPIDTLSGFDEAIASKLLLYCERKVLSETEKSELDKTILYLQSLTYHSRVDLQNRPQVSVRYFVPCSDQDSEWRGICKTLTGICQKVDAVQRTITVDEHKISFSDIIEKSN